MSLSTAVELIFHLVVAECNSQLSPQSAKYYRRIDEESSVGKKLEEICPPGPGRQHAEANLESVLGRFDELFGKHGDGKVFITGDASCYTDFMLGGFLVGFSVLTSGAERRNFLEWHGGRWEKCLQELRKWEGNSVGNTGKTWKAG